MVGASSNAAALDVCIVIPCYNEEKILEASVEKIAGFMKEMGYSFEFIFVDDCSTDKTRSIITSLVGRLPNARSLFHAQNTGRGGAFMDGTSLSQARYTGFLDIDLEVSPMYIPFLISALQKGADVATVKRTYKIMPSVLFILRHILSVGYKSLVKVLLKSPFADTETGFKFFRTESLHRIMTKCEDKHWFWDTEIMMLAHYNSMKVVEVPGEFIRRKDKVSTVRLWRDSLIYLKAVMKFRKRIRNEKHSVLASPDIPGSHASIVRQ